MSDEKMYLIVTLRKEVADREAGAALYELVKTWVSDKPGIVVSGMVNNHFEGQHIVQGEPEP